MIQISDDEKFYFKNEPFNMIYHNGFENAKDIIAFGFDPIKTFIFSNHDYRKNTPEFEDLVEEMNKNISFHSLHEIFGLDESANVGMINWVTYQTAAAFYQAYPRIFKEPALCLVSYMIDQDPYFRLGRDLARKKTSYVKNTDLDTKREEIKELETSIPVLRGQYLPPCSIIGKFIPALTGIEQGKKSSSTSQQTNIFFSDSPEIITEKIKKYVTSDGEGNDKLDEQQKSCGNISKDIACQYLIFFEHDDIVLKDILNGFSKGTLTSKDTKDRMIAKIVELVMEHQRRRALVTNDDLRMFYSQWKYLPSSLPPYLCPSFSYPGTILPEEIAIIAHQYITQQINNIGTHTRSTVSEGDFQFSQEAEKEYIYWIGALYCRHASDVTTEIDGYMCGGATEANIEGLWIHRNMHQAHGFERIHFYFTKLTHYSIIKACNILGIPKDRQHVVPLNEQYVFDCNIFAQMVSTFDENAAHVVVLTLGSTLIGGCDDVKEVNRICLNQRNLQISIHIDAAFGGHVLPFMSDEPYGFEHSCVQSMALDADKNGNLPYPAGVFLCRKNLQKFIEIHVDYILGHCDDTLSGSRTGMTALMGVWYIHEVGYSGQSKYAHQCVQARNELRDSLSKIKFVDLLPSSKFINQLAFSININEDKRRHLEEKYLLRGQEIDGRMIYKICVMPHMIPYITSFVADVSME